MSHPFDATLKEILGEAPADLQKAFRLPAVEPAQPLNVDLSTISAATDIALGFGDPIREIADLNFQSGPDPAVAARLHLYNAAFHLKFAVPVRSILVLLRPKAETPGLNGKLSYVSGRKRVTFQYDVIHLWQQPVERYLQGGLSLLPLAPLCKITGRKPLDQGLRAVIREIDRRLGLLPDHAKAVRLMTATFILTGMRVPKESLSSLFEGVKIMHQTSAFDAYVEEGLVKGEQRVLLKIGRQHLGDPDAKTEAALNAIEDPDRLERMADAILKVKSWKALLAIK